MTDNTSPVALRGTLHGSNRGDLIKAARDKAATYFGTGCVTVKLENERPHPMMSGFNAEFVAVEWHDVQHRTYGPDRCLGCGRDSWPQHPLNEVAREE